MLPGAGAEDLQRSYIDYNGNLVVGAPAVGAFQSAASFHLGVTTQAAGLPLIASEVGGGIFNIVKGRLNGDLSTLGNHPRNIVSMEQGFKLSSDPSQQPIPFTFLFTDSAKGAIYNFGVASDGGAVVTSDMTPSSPDDPAHVTTHYAGSLTDLVSVTFGNGANVKFTFDTSNQVQSVTDKVETIDDHGAKMAVDYDQTNSGGWSLQRTGYSADNYSQPLYSVEVADNGTISSFLWHGADFTAADIGSIFGSSLGKLLGGNSLVGQVAAGTLTGAIGHEIGEALRYGTSFTIDGVVTNAFGSLAGVPGIGAVPSATLGALSSLLIGELADRLHLTGFEHGLFQSAGTTVTTQLVTNIYGVMTGAVHTDALHTPWGLADGFDAASLGTNISGAVGAYFGQYLAGQIVSAHDQSGAIGGQIGSSIGAAVDALTPLGSFLGSGQRSRRNAREISAKAWRRNVTGSATEPATRAISTGKTLRLLELKLAA
jgi:hypothetical protein